MPPNPNETLAERAERIEAELMAAEQEAAEELMRKRDALRRARAQRSLEEAAQRVREEEARKAQEAREEAERRAQEEAREAARRRVLGENEANAHPEEDGDFVFEDAMDIDDGAASPSKRKKATKVLVARTGDQRCRGCVSRKTACLVDEARVKKWKQLVAEGTVLTRAPPGVVCSECASKKHKCFLPELERERATMKPAVKRKREEEDEPRASGSKEATGAAGEGAEEAPKKKVKTQEPRVVEEKNGGQDEVVVALEFIGKGLAALVRAVNESNWHLEAIADHAERSRWDLWEDDESEGEGSAEWDSGDEQVARGSGNN